MAQQDMFSLIHARYNAFTNTEKKVADYILENGQSVIYMSITDLADTCGVGESSVFRFCKALDFKGYQEFKIVLAHSISTDQEVTQLSNTVTLKDTTSEMSAKILNANIHALTETYNLLEEELIEQAAEKFVSAEQIHFFGVGSSSITAMEAKNKFMHITNKTNFVQDGHMQVMSAALLSERDVAVVISYSGSTKDSIAIAKTAKASGATVIAITRFVKSPLTSYSDMTLLCGANEGPLQGGSLTAKISQLYLLDLLYFEYVKRTSEESTHNKDLTAQAVAEKLL